MAEESIHPLCDAIPIPEAQAALGGKARSEIYKCAGRGELDLIKDGARTLVTVELIKRFQATRPRAVLQEPPHLRESRKRRRRTSEAAA